ncbi:MAG: flagellar basal-body rod protein FlgF [Bdellovibrionales bacterium]|nr:flagellar basal-body rod protein FlgF [Bdellovibrionales bacterium]
MSTKGIFTALSGAVAQSQRLDTIANNIANSNTTGFKKDNQVFKEYLTAVEKPPAVIQVPRVPASIESFYDMQGTDRGYVDANGTYTSHEQGSLKATGSPLDLALQGDGFFEVLTPSGPQFTRAGTFRRDVEGRLVTKEGYPVLKEGYGQPAEGRLITISSPNITVSQRGEIYEGGEALGKLSMVTMANKEALQKRGQSLFALKPGAQVPVRPANEALVEQGFIELSNVNVVKEMTDMISATRAFESTQKAIQAFDQMDQKLVNDVPRLN